MRSKRHSFNSGNYQSGKSKADDNFVSVNCNWILNCKNCIFWHFGVDANFDGTHIQNMLFSCFLSYFIILDFLQIPTDFSSTQIWFLVNLQFIAAILLSDWFFKLGQAPEPYVLLSFGFRFIIRKDIHIQMKWTGYCLSKIIPNFNSNIDLTALIQLNVLFLPWKW